MKTVADYDKNFFVETKINNEKEECSRLFEEMFKDLNL